MSTLALTQDQLVATVTTPFGKDKLFLRSLAGDEGLSDLYAFHLEMDATSADLAPATVVGKGVGITIALPGGTKRHIHGLAVRFLQGATDARGLTRYWAEVRPWTWMLTLSTDCRIFQDTSVVEIIKTVCSDQGYTDIDTSGLKKTYAKREYCVQYRETAYAFIVRLMAEEGIFFFFRHEAARHILMLADDADAHGKVEGIAKALYAPAESPAQRLDGLLDCTLEHAVTTGKVALDDWNFETPDTTLFSKADGTASKMRRYDYPGRFLKKDEGEAYAKLRLAAYEVPGVVLRGTSAIAAFVAGAKVMVDGHPRKDVNADWVLRRVRHEISEDRYLNQFDAFPLTQAFRPWPEVPKPLIAGTQTAIVVGKSGEEIWTDAYGRIKVQFHWDQLGKNDENSSCWVRVSQGWAGKGWGSLFLPRIGQEVVVSFEEGDPDRPLVTGAVYNADQMVPYTLPDDQTKSTIKTNSSKGGEGFNELRFEDKKGSEEVYFQAEKDMNGLVKNQRAVTIDKADDQLTLNEGNRAVTIKKGDDALKIETGSRTTDIKKDETLTVDGKRTLTVTGKETHTGKDDFEHKVSGDYTLTVDGNLIIKAKSVTIQSTSDGVTVKAAQAFDATAGSTGTIKATGDLSLKGNNATLEAAMNLTAKGGMNSTVKGALGLTLDGGLQLNGKGTAVSIKADAMATVEGSAMGSFKGAITRIG